MLNEVPNNNDSMHTGNYHVVRAPNSNDAMCIANNVRLITIGAK